MQLIKGQYNAQDALHILTQMVHVKIKFHESKIESSDNEEDIKMRESRIKQLQEDLYEFRQLTQRHPHGIRLESTIQINPVAAV
ncbi:MAG: hypothetical protein LPK45_08840 [Bacteroidota bacterium]|nr:hypothetical protein [Bacteroidota bacterium]MDX5431190.1 hypothetical protein [Bacteroidota bacterium]MDX5469929.1 hypothetical protein [Bacteroidota bacterium]